MNRSRLRYKNLSTRASPSPGRSPSPVLFGTEAISKSVYLPSIAASVGHSRDTEPVHKSFHKIPSQKHYSPLRSSGNKEYKFKLNKIRMLARKSPMSIKRKLMPNVIQGFFEAIKRKNLKKDESLKDFREISTPFVTNFEEKIQKETLERKNTAEASTVTVERDVYSPGRISVLIKHHKHDLATANRKTFYVRKASLNGVVLPWSPHNNPLPV
ncbi:unnamed protein product [Blepharisma stoltei]|uniref:Ribosomal protein S3 n=1 Tax=Blepharisma stoltei TaxID=1481888 RepID=A0AAU9J4K9_9CILI|nr:unnamed protein product [Blepharisma stoltei]